RATHGARLVAPAGGGGRLAAITLGPASGRPTVPTPDDSNDAVWTDLALSPDGRWVAGIRCSDGRWALMLWPAQSPSAAVALLETRGSLADVVWTSDGELWFVADPTGLPQVYRWTDSAAVQPLTAERFGARAPAPLADGGLLYAGLTARGWELRRTGAAASSRSGPVTFAAPLAFDSARASAVPRRLARPRRPVRRSARAVGAGSPACASPRKSSAPILPRFPPRRSRPSAPGAAGRTSTAARRRSRCRVW